MVRIAITQAAYKAICATLPLGSVGVEPSFNDRGDREIWIERDVADWLGDMRGSGEMTEPTWTISQRI